MKYLDSEDVKYTAAGILAVVSFMAATYGLSLLGWLGVILTILMILGLGAILGSFIQTWHIDYKFEQELDGFEDSLREALSAKKPDHMQ